MNFFDGRAAGRKLPSVSVGNAAQREGLRAYAVAMRSWPPLRLLLMAMLAFTAASCGVKSDLEKPDGTTTAKSVPNPSKPPYPIGR